MKIRILNLLLVSLFIGASTEAAYKTTETCATLAKADPQFDLEACQSEMDKKLYPIDYRALHPSLEQAPWIDSELTLHFHPTCQNLSSKAYSTDNLESHLNGISSMTSDPSEKQRGSTPPSAKKKKNPCLVMIHSERELLKKIKALAESLTLPELDSSDSDASDSDGSDSDSYSLDASDLSDSSSTGSNFSQKEWVEEISKMIENESAHHSALWPSELALKIGLFLKDQNQIAASLQFLKLLLSSSFKIRDLELLQLSTQLIDKYNEFIQIKNTSPTADTFLLVQGALHFLNGIQSLENPQTVFAQKLTSELKKVRNHMVRWPLSPQGIVEDTYFPRGDLARMVYHRTFIDQLLSDLEKLGSLSQIDKYQGRKNIQSKTSDLEQNTDLADLLYHHGFYGVEGFCNNHYQHTWIHPNGFIVRTKKSAHTGGWEFTLGLTFINPLNWKKSNWEQTRATSLVKLPELMKVYPELKGTPYLDIFSNPAYHRTLIQFKYNEVFKLRVTPQGWITLMPAFQGTYTQVHKTQGHITQTVEIKTADHWNPQMRVVEALKSAHYPLSKVGHTQEDLSIIRHYYISNL